MSFFSLLKEKKIELEPLDKWLKFSIYFNKIVVILTLFFFTSLIFLIIFIKNSSLSIFFAINNKSIIQIRYFLLVIFVIIFIFTFLLMVSFFYGKVDDYFYFFLQYFFLSFFSGNLLIIANLIFFCYYYKSKNKLEINKNKLLSSWKIKFGIKKWVTKDYVLVALFTAITVLFAYLEGSIIPNLPNGGTVSLKYIPLIIISFIHSTLAGLLTGGISALLSLIFVQSYVVSPWSYLLDYFLPLITPCIAGIMCFNNKRQTSKYIIYVNYVIMCFSIYFLIWIWQVLSGYFIWNIVFPVSIWQGYSGWLYAIVYNFISIFILTYPISQIIIPIILRTLVNYY